MQNSVKSPLKYMGKLGATDDFPQDCCKKSEKIPGDSSSQNILP